jgi:hypothetical protein
MNDQQHGIVMQNGIAWIQRDETYAGLSMRLGVPWYVLAYECQWATEPLLNPDPNCPQCKGEGVEYVERDGPRPEKNYGWLDCLCRYRK